MGRIFISLMAGTLVMGVGACAPTPPRVIDRVVYVDVPVRDACIKREDVPVETLYDYARVERGQSPEETMRHILVSTVQLVAVEKYLRALLMECTDDKDEPPA